MIPNNRPAICKSTKGGRDEVLSILSKEYAGLDVNLVFSCRQGLDIIYRNLYDKFGSLTIATSPLVCFEALYPILRNNHEIAFVDVNPDTFNMDETLIPEDVSGIQPIHFGGNPQNMDAIMSIAQKNDLVVIEDCAQGLGSYYDNKPVGTFGDCSAFSLMKNLYALGGGFTISNEKLHFPLLSPLGIVPTAYRILKRWLESRTTTNSQIIGFALRELVKAAKSGDSSAVFSERTVNRPITQSIHTQLTNMECLISRRIEVAERIRESIDNSSLNPQSVLRGGSSNYTRLLFRLECGDSKSLIKELRKRGVGANHLTQDSVSFFQEPVWENDALRKFVDRGELRNYSDIHDKILSLPVSPSLTKVEVDYMLSLIDEIVQPII